MSDMSVAAQKRLLADSDSASLGSNPSPPATPAKGPARKRWPLLFSEIPTNIRARIAP